MSVGDSSRESFIQVNQPGSGPKIRNVALDVVQPDGTVATVNLQVVTLADDEGNFIDFRADLLRELLDEQRKTNVLLEAVIEALS